MTNKMYVVYSEISVTRKVEVYCKQLYKIDMDNMNGN